jgi:antibiotic biosynthesis monooxygenase (ABM) superfamily enzyme
MMQLPEHLFVVRASVDPEHEAAFNRWYDEEHLADAARLPGCIGAARYRVLEGDGSHQYLAVYAFASEAALRAVPGSPHLQALVDRYDEAVGQFSRRARTTYTRITSLPLDGGE